MSWRDLQLSSKISSQLLLFYKYPWLSCSCKCLILVTIFFSRLSHLYCHLCHMHWISYSFCFIMFQQVILKWFSYDHNSVFLLYSGCLCWQFSPPISQQCKILMKALRNSMLKVVYMTGLTALFRYPSQVTALYSEGEMQQLLQCAFSTWVRKKGNQQMINTPLKQKKADDQKMKPAKHLGCNKMKKKKQNNFWFVNTTFYRMVWKAS